MKKGIYFLTAMVICFFCLLNACAGQSSTAGSDLDMENIPFRTIYRGFSAAEWEDTQKMEAFTSFGTQMLTSEEAWGAFMADYCPGIPYYESFDFSRDCLMASITMGAKLTYANSFNLVSLGWRDGQLVYLYDEDPNTFQYALNDDNIVHFLVEVYAIRKDDLPENRGM